MEKRIYSYDFKNTLRNMPNISQKERDYLNRVFSKELMGGLSSLELRQKINQLYYNQKDELDRGELESLRKKLLGKMGK